jgi:hypothetical protein
MRSWFTLVLVLPALAGCSPYGQACTPAYPAVFGGFTGTVTIGGNASDVEWLTVIAGFSPDDGRTALVNALFRGSGESGSFRVTFFHFRIVMPVPLTSGDSMDIVGYPADTSIVSFDGFTSGPRPPAALIYFTDLQLTRRVPGQGSAVVEMTKGPAVIIRLRAESLPGASMSARINGRLTVWQGEYPEECYGT